MILALLIARPVWITKEPPAAASRSVVLLVDRSESMSIDEPGETRYRQSLGFLGERLLPALKSAQLPVQAMLFDETAEPSDGQHLAAAVPKGKRTNLAGAIKEAIINSPQPPLAVVALTDGIANENDDNTRALTALVDSRVPFIGVGLGSDQGVRTLSLRDVEAPTTVSTRTSFSIAAQLEMMNTDEMPGFDLLLYRDGKMAQKKTVAPGKGSRTWLENFQLTEDKQGVHTYTVQLLPPQISGLKCVNALANTSVRISDEKELRILYIQGALTWDYKFISMALHNDQTIKLTGLTRTSKQSVFRQNVESAGELLNGFPTSLEELAPFRVVVLSNLRPSDLTPLQQEMLGRFCGELGGGVLMIGGPATFDSSWATAVSSNSCPWFSPVAGRPRPRPALPHAAHRRSTAASGLPDCRWPARARRVGAVAHLYPVRTRRCAQTGRTGLGRASNRRRTPRPPHPHGLPALRRRPLSDPFDSEFLALAPGERFRSSAVRPLLAAAVPLSQRGRAPGRLHHLADQELHPQMDVQVVLEKQPNPKNITDTNRKFFVRVEDGQKHLGGGGRRAGALASRRFQVPRRKPGTTP